MAFETRENEGALFRNDKGNNPKRPDYRGDIKVGGQLYKVSAWINEMKSKPGEKYMALKLEPKEAAPVAPTPAPADPQAGRADDPLPF